MQNAKCEVQEGMILLRNCPCSRQIDYRLLHLGHFGLRFAFPEQGDAAVLITQLQYEEGLVPFV